MEKREAQLAKMKEAEGFIAALDQSGGSTPKALDLYGVDERGWSNDIEMFDLVHAMRCRIIESPAFTGNRVIAAILFENTMKNVVDEIPTSSYLWGRKQILPILKIDKGLAEEIGGVQMMKPMPTLDNTLADATDHEIFGTKMRSVIKKATGSGIRDVVEQQFDIGKQVLASGLVPIIEPEVDIGCPEKEKAEGMLRDQLMKHLDTLPEGSEVILKLTLPQTDDFYADCISHERTLRVVALSGGYSRGESNERLSRQKGMIASFSRALTEGLRVDQTEDEFNSMLDSSISSIVEASKA